MEGKTSVVVQREWDCRLCFHDGQLSFDKSGLLAWNASSIKIWLFLGIYQGFVDAPFHGFDNREDIQSWV